MMSMMDDRAMHPPLAIPADVHHLVVILVAVHDRFTLDLAVRWRPSGVLLDHSSDDLSVSFDSIHLRILSTCHRSKSR